MATETRVDSGGLVATKVERGPTSAHVALRVNGTERLVDLEPRTSLLDALREHLELTGSKKGCDQGTCGACTVWVDGRRVLACLTLAVACEGREVTTIEGVGVDGEPHPMQRAFVEHDAFQCGYCTPGQIMSAIALIEEGNASTDEAIAEFMSGNICRCAAYPNIRAAIREVRDADRLAMPGRPTSQSAITLVAGDPGSAFLAGGTTKVDLLRLGVEHTDRLSTSTTSR